MTLTDLKGLKNLTAQRTLTVIALGLCMFIIGDTRSALRAIQVEQVAHAETMRENVKARDAAIARQAEASTEMIRLLRAILDTAQEKCAQDARTPAQMRDCYDPPKRIR